MIGRGPKPTEKMLPTTFLVALFHGEYEPSGGRRGVKRERRELEDVLEQQQENQRRFSNFWVAANPGE